MSLSTLIDLSSTRVLCVDDDPVMRSVVRSALQRRGCREVVQANGGIDGLDLCAGRTFDLVICDYQMSPMTGLEFIRALINSGLGEGWPIVMLSAETDPATIQEAHALGVSAWIGKPISIQTLIERVSGVLRLNGRIDAAPDSELIAMGERYHARLMAALTILEETAHGLGYRAREAAHLARGLRHPLDAISETATALGYGLVTRLVGRARDLTSAMERNPTAAARGHADTARALGMLATAMKRVAANRMGGDGAEAGRRLMGKIDGIVAPVRAALD